MDFCVPCVYRKRNSFCTVLADTVRAIRVRVTACVRCMRVRFSGPGSLFVTMNGMGVTQVRIKRVYEKPGTGTTVSAFWSTVFGRGESVKRTCPTIYGPRRSLRRPDCGVGSIGTRRKDGANFREGTGWSSKAAIRPGRFSRRSVSIASLRCCTHRRMLRRITR